MIKSLKQTGQTEISYLFEKFGHWDLNIVSCFVLRISNLVGLCAVALLTLVYPDTIHAAPDVKIVCQGNRLFTDAEVRERLTVPPGQNLNDTLLQDQLRLLLEAYRAQGYLWAKARWEWQAVPGSDRMRLQISIDEGRPARIGALQVRGVTVWSAEEVRHRLGLREGERYDARRLEEGVHALVGRYEDCGYPFAAVRVESLTALGDSLCITLQVQEGEAALVREITVTGNAVTRRKVVVRELGIKPGAAYSRARTAAGETRLMKLGLFKQVAVRPAALDSTGSALRLVVEVSEGAMNDLAGVAGFVPGDGDQSGYLTGRFDVAVRNLFGTGRAMSARWEKLDRRSVDLHFRYEEPWVLGTPVRAGGEFEQLHQEKDNGQFTYARTRAGLFAGLPFGVFFSGTVTFFREEVVPDSAARLFMDQTRTYGLALALQYDRRDHPSNPAAGALFETGAEYNYRAGTPDQERYLLGLEHYQPLAGRHVAAFRWRGRWLQDPQAVAGYQEFFELGGSGSVRGYREGQFYGSRVTWLNLEYKYFVDRLSSVYLFLDNGYYYRPAWSGAGAAAEENIVGYGLGGIFSTRVGVLKIEYGLGGSDRPMDGKIHVKWGSSF
jgi:outer membrane protein assembly factor BamA